MPYNVTLERTITWMQTHE